MFQFRNTNNENKETTDLDRAPCYFRYYCACKKVEVQRNKPKTTVAKKFIFYQFKWKTFIFSYGKKHMGRLYIYSL